MPSHFSVRLYLHASNQTRHLINISFLFCTLFPLPSVEKNTTKIKWELILNCFVLRFVLIPFHFLFFFVFWIITVREPVGPEPSGSFMFFSPVNLQINKKVYECTCARRVGCTLRGMRSVLIVLMLLRYYLKKRESKSNWMPKAIRAPQIHRTHEKYISVY